MVDLIASLTAELAIQPHEARALAGGLLGHIRRAVASQEGAEAAAQVMDLLPEAAALQDEARRVLLHPAQTNEPPVVHQGDGLFDDEGLEALRAQLGLARLRVGLALPPLLNYLKSRLPPDLLDLVCRAEPALASAAPERRPPDAVQYEGEVVV